MNHLRHDFKTHTVDLSPLARLLIIIVLGLAAWALVIGLGILIGRIV